MRGESIWLLILLGLALGTASLRGGRPPAEAASIPLAIGVPVGPEPEGWEDLRDVPFEVHLADRSESGPMPGCIQIPLEIRPGGRANRDFDGSRALPFGLFRRRPRGHDAIPAVLGSGAQVRVMAPYDGWESSLPLDLLPGPGETSLREITLEVEFLRLLEWKDVVAHLAADGDLDPVPLPLHGKMRASPERVLLTAGPGDHVAGITAFSRDFSADPRTDLWQGRDAAGRRIRWSGTLGVSGFEFSHFEIWAPSDVPIAYPVAMRFREPIRWTRRAYRFVLKDLPIPR